MSKILDKRYEFVLFFEVENGNPNGDPDAGNMPRIDPETSHGLVTDVCLKRKVRNYVELNKGKEDGFEIYVKENGILNNEHKKAYDFYNIKQVDNKLPVDQQEAMNLTKFMCKNFYDIRTFGAVMTTKWNCGQVRGPVQLSFAKSIDAIVPQEVTITRMAVTKVEDAEKERTVGRKFIVPYALYRVEGYISASLAQKTEFTETDLEIFWDSLINMFEHDHSAARGKMASRKLVIFEHSTALGNAPAHKLFELVTVERKDAIKPPRAFDDYTISVNHAAKPESIKIVER